MTFARRFREKLVEYMDDCELMLHYGVAAFLDPAQKKLSQLFSILWQVGHPRPVLDNIRMEFSDFESFSNKIH